jgi:hypothetical protein
MPPFSTVVAFYLLLQLKETFCFVLAQASCH